MESKPILTKKIGRIGVITLNRPEAKNTFTVPFAEQLDQAFWTMDQDPDILVVVINANGKHFSTGISLDQFHHGSQREYRDFLNRIDAFYHRLARMKEVTIASVRGYALDTMDDLFATLCSTEDAVEGVQAFLGKRAPTWKER